jgi:hypothetical protein
MLHTLTLWVLPNNPTCARAVSALSALPKVLPPYVAYEIKDADALIPSFPVTHVPQLVFSMPGIVVYRLIGLENLTVENVLNTLAKLET